MNKHYLITSSTYFNNIFWMFCLQQNNECEWFIEMNEALL